MNGYHVSCDAVGRGQDFGKYRILIVPVLSVVDEGLVEKLVAFVQGGGTLVWHPLSGIKNMEATIYRDRLHPKLAELFGVDVREYATSGRTEPSAFTFGGRRFEGNLFHDLPVLQGAEALGAYVDGWYAGTPAVTLRRWGTGEGPGRATYVATFAAEAFYGELIGGLCRELGIEPSLAAPENEALEIVERRGADGRRLVFLLNFSEQEQGVELPRKMHDVWNQEEVMGRCLVKPRGVRVLAE